MSTEGCCAQQLDADGSKSVSKQEWMSYFQSELGDQPEIGAATMTPLEYVTISARVRGICEGMSVNGV